MNLAVRRASPADLDALVALFADFAAEQTTLDARLAYAEDAVQLHRNTLRDALRSDTFVVFVVEVGGEIVGYQSAEHWYEAPLYRGGREVFLHELYVRPEHRGQGIGVALAQAAVAWAQAERAVRLRFNVLAENSASRALWEKLGATQLSATYTLELAEAPPEPNPHPLGFSG